MLYNLNEDHKQVAKFLVDQYRDNHIPLDFTLHIDNDKSSIMLFPYDRDPTHSGKKFQLRVAYSTIHILAEERLLWAKQYERSSLRDSFHCALLERVFSTVDTNFGEIESNEPKSENIAGLGLNAKNYRSLLSEYFNIGEIKSLCTDMDIDFEALPHAINGSKDDLCRELFLHAKRYGRLLELYTTTIQQRPKNNWSKAWE